MAVDDFEPCESLKSKKGLHKMCGVYMEVRNIHPELRSKLCNKLLVAMVNTQNSKGKNVSFDNVALKIVSDLRILESDGIKIASGKVLMGALINISADNQGANSIMGFVECFNAHFYCRICECTKSECQNLDHEVSSKLRQNCDYAPPEVDEDVETDYKASKGVKKILYFQRFR